MARHWLSSLFISTHVNACIKFISLQPLGLRTIIIIAVLRRRKLKHREGKSPAQGHTVDKWQSQELNPGSCLMS